MQCWRIFYTAPRAELKCEERLLEQAVDVFLPKIATIRKWKDRKKKVEEALFRSYIFANVDEKDRLYVLQTPGIVRCVAFGGKLAEMTTDEIEQLKITRKDPEQLALFGPWIPPVGKAVTVTEGPMQGLSGEVIQHRGQTHVIVRIETLKQAVKVNVPIEWVCETSQVYVAP